VQNNTPEGSLVFKIKEISIQNSQYEFSSNLIVMNKIETYEDFQIDISNLHFDNLNFTRGGNLLQIQQHVTNGVVISNSSATNIKGGSFYFKSLKTFTNNARTIVKFSNFTANTLDQQYGSFILVNEGTDLEIRDSSFTNAYCFEEGSVVFAGYQKALVDIYSTVFENNTAIEGGVFFIESQSLVK
jgi:hypothetical protein